MFTITATPGVKMVDMQNHVIDMKHCKEIKFFTMLFYLLHFILSN